MTGEEALSAGAGLAAPLRGASGVPTAGAWPQGKSW
jgi:hypothetical protein